MSNASLFAQFPGQGSQKIGMGVALFEKYPLAQEYYKIAESKLGFSLYDICKDGPIEKLTMTEIAQPAILTVSAIVFELVKGKFDIKAGAGHSLGEYSALVAAGAISYEDAVLVVHKRGKYMQNAVPAGTGKMVAVLGKDLSELETALSNIEGVAEIANINAPGQIVVSGDVKGVDNFVKALGTAKVIELPVSAPFHCSLMKEAEVSLAEDLKALKINKPNFPIISNFTAEPTTDPEVIRENLIKQVCGRVRWVETIEKAKNLYGISEAIEFGFGNTLTGMLKRIDKSVKGINIEDPASVG